MPEEMSDEKINKVVKKKRDFYYHLGIYVGVNILIIGVWALTDIGPDVDYPWFIWSWIVWGIGIIFHYLWAFIFDRKSDKEAE